MKIEDLACFNKIRHSQINQNFLKRGNRTGCHRVPLSPSLVLASFLVLVSLSLKASPFWQESRLGVEKRSTCSPKGTGLLLAHGAPSSSRVRETDTRVHSSLVGNRGWLTVFVGPGLGACVQRTTYTAVHNGPI